MEREQALKKEIEEWKKRYQGKEKENEELQRQIKQLQDEKANLLK